MLVGGLTFGRPPASAIAPVLCALTGPARRTSGRSRSPGPGWATLRLPEPSQSEGDRLTSDLTYPLSLSDGDPERVTVRPQLPDSDAILMPPMDTRGSGSIGLPAIVAVQPRPTVGTRTFGAGESGASRSPVNEVAAASSISAVRRDEHACAHDGAGPPAQRVSMPRLARSRLPGRRRA